MGKSILWRALGRGRPLVLVHGLAGSAETWDRVRARLRTRHTTIAGDLPGHGTAVPWPSFELANHVDVLRDVVTRQFRSHCEDGFVLVGHSLGALAVLRLAMELSSTRLGPRAVVLVDPLTHRRSDTGFERVFLPFTELPSIPTAKELRLIPPMLLAGLSMRCMYSGMIPDSSLARAVEHMQTPGGLEGIVETLREFFLEDVGVEDFSLNVPSLVLFGERDRLISHSAFRCLARRLGSELVELPGCGHLPHEEDPGGFGDALEQFLEATAVGEGRGD